MGVFGILRGLVGTNYSLVLAGTIGVAIAQPFLLNAWTKVPAQWFSIEERATAVGLVTLSNLVGTALGMLLTPILIERMPIPTVQLLYGCMAAFSAVLFLIFAREKPPTPPCPPGQEVRALMLDGLKHALRVRVFWFYLFVSFIGMGIFNGITTWVEAIIRPRGFTPADAGTLGALMLGVSGCGASEPGKQTVSTAPAAGALRREATSSSSRLSSSNPLIDAGTAPRSLRESRLRSWRSRIFWR